MNIVVRLLYLPLKSVGELLEVEDAVAILVELADQGNNIILKTLKAVGTLLDLGDNLVEGSLREDVGVIFHVFLGVLVSLEQLEFEAAKENGMAEQEVTLDVVVVADGVAMLLALHELTTNAPRVFIANFVHLNGVVSTVERDNEAARLIIRLGRNKLRLESKNVHVLLEHLLHVNLRRLRLERVN